MHTSRVRCRNGRPRSHQHVLPYLALFAAITWLAAGAGCGATMPAPGTGVTSGPCRLVSVVEDAPKRLEVLATDYLQANNCTGPNVTHPGDEYCHDTTAEINFDVSLRAGFDAGVAYFVSAQVQAALEVKYGHTKGEAFRECRSFSVDAKPGTYWEYPLVWYGVWADGYVECQTEDGQTHWIPYSARHALRMQPANATEVGCP